MPDETRNSKLEIGKSFTAKGGTIFSWFSNDPDTVIEVMVPTGLVGHARMPDLGHATVVVIPGEDLNEFMAHIIGEAAEETLGRVLLFPCLRHGAKLETGNSKLDGANAAGAGCTCSPPDPKDAA